MKGKRVLIIIFSLLGVVAVVVGIIMIMNGSSKEKTGNGTADKPTQISTLTNTFYIYDHAKYVQETDSYRLYLEMKETKQSAGRQILLYPLLI